MTNVINVIVEDKSFSHGQVKVNHYIVNPHTGERVSKGYTIYNTISPCWEYEKKKLGV
jgi:hypothetical protein